METKFKKVEGYWRVIHQQYCTDRYAMGTTIVKAETAFLAMEKLNAYLATEPDGGYTALPCNDVKDVYPFTALI